MEEQIENDINRGYVKFIKGISLKAGQGSTAFKLIKKVLLSGLDIVRIVLIPVLYLYGVIVIITLKMIMLFKNDSSDLHKRAIKYIPEFISQYPMHLYPVVAKALELAFIQDVIGKVTEKVDGGIVELAIGEGTLSKRIFSEREKIVAFDLNPYSLVHVKNYHHVSKMIIADCLNPPIGENGASFIVCNNLLHHVTNKEYTLGNWAKIAPYALFNENTNYWASAWTRPYMLKMIGMRKAAERKAKEIEQFSLQSLWTHNQLDSIVEKFYEKVEEKSFLHERVFFMCAISSSLLFCYGPPTPNAPKKIMNTLLRPITRILTYNLAKTLIEYDATLQRDKDSFVFWIVKSKVVKDRETPKNVSLVCPDCRTPLIENKCGSCNVLFDVKDGMLFLLRKDIAKEISYNPQISTVLSEEHL